MKSRSLLAICAILPALACRGGEPFPDRHALIDSRDTYDPRSLDPALSTDVPTGRAVSYVFDGLTRFTPDARVEPGLADRWEVAGDGLTYTFHLHPGVLFHDGTPLLARHVKTSFERVLDPATRGGRGETLLPIAGARAIAAGTATDLSGVTVVDDSTLVIRLVEPLAFFPKLLAMPAASVVPDSIPSDFGEHPIGSGPWKLVEWRHDDYLKFARNDEYFAGAPLMDTLIARIIPEPSTAVAEFESGRVDLLLIPQGETRNWQQTDEKMAVLQSAPALALYLPFAEKRDGCQPATRPVDVALVVDTVTGVGECTARELAAAEGILPGLEYVQGVAKLKDGLTLIYNLEQFLSLEEEESLDQAMAHL